MRASASHRSTSSCTWPSIFCHWQEGSPKERDTAQAPKRKETLDPKGPNLEKFILDWMLEFSKLFAWKIHSRLQTFIVWENRMGGFSEGGFSNNKFVLKPDVAIASEVSILSKNSLAITDFHGKKTQHVQLFENPLPGTPPFAIPKQFVAWKCQSRPRELPEIRDCCVAHLKFSFPIERFILAWQLGCRKWGFKRWGFKEIRGYLRKKAFFLRFLDFPGALQALRKGAKKAEKGPKRPISADFREGRPDTP